MGTQSAAIFAADCLQRQRQQYLLAQNIFQKQTLTAIVSHFSFGRGDGKLCLACVRALRPVEQIELLSDLFDQRFQATGANHFHLSGQVSRYAYVIDQYVLAVMLANQLGSSSRLENRSLADFLAQIDDARFELLGKINRMGLQFVNFDEHCHPRAPSWYRAGRGSTH